MLVGRNGSVISPGRIGAVAVDVVVAIGVPVVAPGLVVAVVAVSSGKTSHPAIPSGDEATQK